MMRTEQLEGLQHTVYADPASASRSDIVVALLDIAISLRKLIEMAQQAKAEEEAGYKK
jgi:hypothetical protein